MERYFLLGFLGSALALGFAALQRRRVLSVSEGNERMQKIAAAIRAGANAYLKHQYTTVFKVFAIASGAGLRLRRANALPGDALRVPHRRDLLHAGGLHRHAYRNLCERTHRQRSQGKPEQGAEGSLLLRQRDGLFCGWPGHAGCDPVVFPAALRPGLCRAGENRLCHGHERHGRQLHGAVCPRGRRHLYQGCRRWR